MKLLVKPNAKDGERCEQNEEAKIGVMTVELLLQLPFAENGVLSGHMRAYWNMI